VTLISSRSPFIAGGHELPLGLMNCFVHVFMYCYYLVANIRPEYQKNIWWKKHITQLQMVTTSDTTSLNLLDPHHKVIIVTSMLVITSIGQRTAQYL
jgi:hypothetical protein